MPSDGGWLANFEYFYGYTDDRAPERRNNYTLTLTVPYDAAKETRLPAREDAITHMPSAAVDAPREGLTVTAYRLPSAYGKMPVMEHIAANAEETTVTREVSAAAWADRSDLALSFKGFVAIPADGVYRFPLRTRGCARLYLDGRLVTEVMNPPPERRISPPRRWAPSPWRQGTTPSASTTPRSAERLPTCPWTVLGNSTINKRSQS
jgi:hypothetical protein